MVNYMYRDNTKIKVVKIDRDKEYEEVAKVIGDCDPEKNDFLVVGHHNYDHAAKGKNCWEIFTTK